MQNVVVQNGFVAIREDNLKVEEDGEGWETVCYSKKNRTPERCVGECIEPRDISHGYPGEPKVKRLVTASGDLQPTSTRAVLLEKDRTPEKCVGECVESREISHGYAGEPEVKRLVTASGDLQPSSARVLPEKDSSLVNENDELAADNGPTSVDGEPVTSSDCSLTNGQEMLTGNTVSPIIRQESIEDKELSDLNENRYVLKP